MVGIVNQVIRLTNQNLNPPNFYFFYNEEGVKGTE